MPTKNKIKNELTLENKKYLLRLKQSHDKLDKFSGGLLKFGKVAAVAASVGGLAFGLKLATDKAFIQEQALAKLEATLISTNHAAGLTKDELVGLSQELQRMTTFGDEAIQGAQSLLLTFTNIGKDVFPRATETILDLSIGMGQGLKESAVQLGKALNDPIQGVTALRRVGVQLTKTQEEQIKTFTKMGDIVSAQEIILGELNTQFGGQAQARAATFAGKVEQVSNSFGDLLEEIGFVITKNPILLEGLEDILEIFTDLASAVKTYGIFFNAAFKEPETEITRLQDSLVHQFDALQQLIEMFGENSRQVEQSRKAYEKALAIRDAYTKKVQEQTKVEKENTEVQADNFSALEKKIQQVISATEKLGATQEELIDIQVREFEAEGASINQAERFNDALDRKLDKQKQINDEKEKEREFAGLKELTFEDDLGGADSIANIVTQNEQEIAVMQAHIDRKSEMLRQEGAEEWQIQQALAVDLNALNQTMVKNRIDSTSGMFNSLFALTGSKSKALFEITKGLNIADAIVSARSAVISSYNAGTKLGGPVVGAAFAGVAIAETAQMLKGIKDAKLGGGGGGGGGSAPSGGTPSISRSIDSAPERIEGGQGGDVFVSLRIDGVIAENEMDKFVENSLAPAVKRAVGRNEPTFSKFVSTG